MSPKQPEATALERFAIVRPKLAQAADQMNSKIVAFEAQLDSLKLGVAASVPLWIDHEQQESEHLEFMKYHGKWRLLVSHHEAGQPEEELEPLIGAARETRLMAVALFPALLTGLLEASERELERIANASASIDELMKTMRGGT